MTKGTKSKSGLRYIPWKPRKFPYRYVIPFLVIILVIILAYFIFIRNGDGKKDQKNKEISEAVNKIKKREEKIEQIQKEIFSIMEEYRIETGKKFPYNPFNLTNEQKDLLFNLIKNEKINIIKELLKDIVEKRDEIFKLKEEKINLEAGLPKPHVVQRGENHYQIAIDYLLYEKLVDKNEVRKLIERTKLCDYLLPGFKVWNFYDGSEYGTMVTQGYASMSPNELMRTIQKKQNADITKLNVKSDNQNRYILELESNQSQLISQLRKLEITKEELISQIEVLKIEKRKILAANNCLHFLLDSQENLKNQGIIKRVGSFFSYKYKLVKATPGYFKEFIDLGSNRIIHISAKTLRMPKIRKVKLYPKFYREGEGGDYKITIDKNKQEAKITILKPEVLKNQRVVISVK